MLCFVIINSVLLNFYVSGCVCGRVRARMHMWTMPLLFSNFCVCCSCLGIIVMIIPVLLWYTMMRRSFSDLPIKINVLFFLFARYPGGFSQASAWRVHEIDPTRVSAAFYRGLIKTSKVPFFRNVV